MNFSEKLQQTLGKAIKDASNEEIYAALLNTVKEAAADKGRNISEKGRKVYYISAEIPDRKTVIQQPDQPWRIR